jgi:hypothetical protein
MLVYGIMLPLYVHLLSICLWHCRTTTMSFVPSKLMTSSTMLCKMAPLWDGVGKESDWFNGESDKKRKM